MRKNKLSISLLLLLLATVLLMVPVWSQNHEHHLIQKERIQRQIKKTQDLLVETSSERENAYQKIQVYNSQKRNRQFLIRNIDTEIEIIKDSIETQNNSIHVLEQEIEAMKTEFSRLLYEGYKIKNKHSALTYILASEKTNEAFYKMRLLERLAKTRKIQFKAIQKKQSQNRIKLQQLIKSKNQRFDLQRKKKQEIARIEREEEKKKLLIESLNGKEDELIKDLRSKEKQLQILNEKVKEIISQNIENNDDDKSYQQELYPHLSPYFRKNKGSLPWPVKEYIVSSQFGSSKHPELKNITTQNNGIDLLVPPKSNVQAIFDGKVSTILNIPGLGKTILIKHDKFYTVYANLESIFVENKQEVATGEKIGRARDAEELVEIHFEVWEGTKKQNPEIWLLN